MSDALLPAIAGTIVIAIFGMGAGLLLMGIDRICAARMQMRQGPPLLQPFIDIRKLLSKQSVVPANAIPSLFNAAPIVAFASAVMILLYIPIGSINPAGALIPVVSEWGDLILIMYLLTIPALAMVVGGFASGSPYASVGAQREMVTMIAYEFPLAIAIVAIAWRLAVAGFADPFSVLTLASTPIWTVVGPIGILGCIILLLVMAWVTPAELSRVPCDTPEAETELCGGLLVEYSGRNLALFTLSMAVKLVAMTGLTVLLFLPWNLSPVLGISGIPAMGIDLIFFLFKVIIVTFISVSLIRVSMARFRINTVVTLYWGWLTAAGLLGMVLIIVDGMLVSGGCFS
ncbi:MAG: formate hydrogenlyase subunit 4 [Methanomicrobiales archaeon HGW-Methanomicrobiales-4]|nr:MAG: formate hydrogenlyase subunit 4 [Methanomicrobiales archaeon HGW-Methanomicrobiales-4]